MTEPVALVRKDGSAEFTCQSCGQLVVVFIIEQASPAVCLTCQFLEREIPDPARRERVRAELVRLGAI